MIRRRGRRLTAAGLLLVASALITASASDGPAQEVVPDAPQIAQVTDTEPAAEGGLLPGGASSLNETYGDWIVACVQQQSGKRCSLSQQQTNKQTHQRVIAIELTAPVGDKADGTLALPFGLLLDSGITLQIDAAAPTPVRRFRTCVPVGCLVALTYDGKMLAALRKGKLLRVNATAADNGQTLAFGISLSGFANAFARTVELSR